ncbi:MAG: hypothetical protein DI586_09415 [Micavibrio aeruginosavorus]|uniref:histidine kinase n=1 Tax=Micavibrio aeruginosavorus TaxID=349221 RepID=A0A2W5FH39_9BACT|nr:MAG: hypothetical protein DI586_09415 [Micavibrio aeruginosavorus]
MNNSETRMQNTSGWMEDDRLAALRRYQILDTPSEQDFDDLVQLAAQFCNAPVSLISLVDQGRQWFKAVYGTNMAETPLDVSFCKYSILEDEILVVPDATKDSRFENNELVTGEPHIRFYAGAVLKTSDGFPLGTICILDSMPRDATAKEIETLKILARQVMVLLEMKKALYEKEKSEERLHFALDTSAIIGTWDWDMQSDKVYADPRFCRLFAIDPERGRNGVALEEFEKAIFADDREAVAAKIKVAVETASDFSAEYRVINHEGEMCWVFARGHAYLDDQGKPLRFPGAAVDITDRKRWERKQAARVELNERLRVIRRTSDVTFAAAEIIGRTLEGARAGYGEMSEEGDVISIERDWTSGEVDSIAGVHTFKHYGHEFARRIKAGDVIVADDILNDPLFAEGHDNIKKIGIRSLINVSLIQDGKPKALFFIHDTKPRHWREGEIELVTEMALRTWSEAERVYAEEEMRRALKKAEAASIAKTEFLANMSHEIRTPMNAIVGLSNILVSEKLTPRQTEFVKTLASSADSLLDLINDLLDISKIEARTVELENIPFDLSAMLAEIVSMMNVRAAEKGLSFNIDDECARNRFFVGDPTRLRQIIVNLCSNAIKFTEAGRVDISVVCHETENPQIENIEIAVTDTGIGIPPDKIETVFEKFIQADTSINRRYGGTGLGLAITRMLAKLMGGQVAVESVVGEGSTFTITIPLPLAEEIKELSKINRASDPEQMNENWKKRILLVEDYAPNILVAGSFLEEFGYEWDSAKSGSEAVEKVLAEKFAAVLMDVQMFGMNGLEATRLIRAYEKENNLPRLPIIGMTAHALAGDRERCLGVGMDDYISKPFNPDDLQDKLEKITGLTKPD